MSDRELKRDLKLALNAPEPTRKSEFLNQLPYPKATNFEFYISQLTYIRKRFWCLSLLVAAVLLLIQKCHFGTEAIGGLSAAFPLLTLIGITEISRSLSFRMTELEMSCKYNLSKLTLIRLSVIALFHLILVVTVLIVFKERSQCGLIRYALYTITPCLLSSSVSLWIINHFRSKDTLYVCSGVTAVISMIIFIMSEKFAMIYQAKHAVIWSVIFIAGMLLLIKEMHCFLQGKNEKWSFV